MSTREASKELNRPSAVRHALALAIAACLCAGNSVAQSDSAEVLRAELRERDRLITDLVQRVEELERRVDSDSESTTTVGSVAPQARARSAARAAAPAQPNEEPGLLDVDQVAAERALERTLTSLGVLLLPKGQVELEPFFTYTRRESIRQALLLPRVGFPAIRRVEDRSNEYDFGLRARVGLPFDAQLELDLPYRVVNRKLVIPDSLDSYTAPANTGSSIGDVQVSIAKTLLRERGWMPDLIGRLTWDTDTGSRTDNDVALGIGFNEFRVRLTALKRQDPLAFTLGAFYETSDERGGIEPGDKYGLTLGTSLAASPETALSVALSQTFFEETQVDGTLLRESGGVSSTLFLGASSLLLRNALLAISVGIGLTENAPDYIVNVSLPIRF